MFVYETGVAEHHRLLMGSLQFNCSDLWRCFTGTRWQCFPESSLTFSFVNDKADHAHPPVFQPANGSRAMRGR